MTVRTAWDRVALAGRELGGGPQAVLPRFPGVVETVEQLVPNSPHKDAIAVGIIVGMVASGDETTLATLRRINRDWLAGRT